MAESLNAIKGGDKMVKHLKYLCYVLKHKWFVIQECYKMGILWRGLTHDISKFYPSEWKPYADYFYGNYPSLNDVHGDQRNYVTKFKEDVDTSFNIAWLHHQKRNKHHWQYWLLTNDNRQNTEFLIQQFDPTQPLLIYSTELNKHIAEFGGDYEEQTEAFRKLSACLNSVPTALPMPDVYRKEMLCDWRGAGRAIKGKDETKEWYLNNKRNIILHPETRAWVEKQLEIQ